VVLLLPKEKLQKKFIRPIKPKRFEKDDRSGNVESGEYERPRRGERGFDRPARGFRKGSFPRDKYSDQGREDEGFGEELHFDNLNRSVLGSFMINNLNIYPPMFGFGVPQRTYTYITGKARPS